MAKDLRQALLDCVELMLRPIIRFCVVQSVAIQDFIELVRILYVQAAAAEMEKRGEEVTVSRLSIVTGLQRRAIDRIYKREESKDSISITTRVIGQWRSDRRFQNKAGRPRTLGFKGLNNDFTRLVTSISKELRPKTVMYDLERIGAVEITDKGLKLKAKAYQPRNNPIEEFKLISRNTHDALMAALENIETEDGQLPNFHATSIYDNIDIEQIPEIRQWFMKECDKFHTKVEKYLSQHDLDINPESKKNGGKRVVYGSFTRTK